MRTTFLTILLSVASVCVADTTPVNPTSPVKEPSLTADETIFVQNIVKSFADNGLLYHKTVKTEDKVILLLVFKGDCTIYTLVGDAILDVVELKGNELIVYPREFD